MDLEPDTVVLGGDYAESEKAELPENVVVGPFNTRLDIPVDRVRRAAQEENLRMLVSLGWTKDGELYFASSSPNKAEMCYLLNTAMHKLMNGDFG